MQMQLTLDSEILNFKLPPAVQSRLQELLDRQEQGMELSSEERAEAEGLVELAEFLTLIRLRSKTAPPINQPCLPTFLPYEEQIPGRHPSPTKPSLRP